MKKIKFLSLFLIVLSAVTFTSCWDDDDNDSTITAAERQEYYNTVRGSYTGNLIYSKADAGTDVTANDTVTISWAINTDTTMVIYNMPSKAIASMFTNEELRSGIEAMPAQDITCYINFLKANNNVIQWLVNPYSLTYDNVSYNGGNHKIQVAFYIASPYSFGAYSSSLKTMQMEIVGGGAYIDGQRLTSGVTAKAFHFLKR